MLTKLNRWLRQSVSEEGFTLIELVIVIGILGVLAAIAVPRYQDYLTEARTNADDWTIRAIEGVLELYKSANGDYPLTAGFAAAMGDYFDSWPPAFASSGASLSYTYPQDPDDGMYSLSY